MTVYVALLRAINVGGTGLLPMGELKDICVGLGFADVATYIQSGNVVFRSALTGTEASVRLEAALCERRGKPAGVLLRDAAKMQALRSPFADAEPSKVLITFLPSPPPADALDRLVAAGGERVVVTGREIFIHYPDGSGRSKLKLPLLATGTARNLNTVLKLAAMAAAAEG